jgi:hypothetical protein
MQPLGPRALGCDCWPLQIPLCFAAAGHTLSRCAGVEAALQAHPRRSISRQQQEQWRQHCRHAQHANNSRQQQCQQYRTRPRWTHAVGAGKVSKCCHMYSDVHGVMLVKCGVVSV